MTILSAWTILVCYTDFLRKMIKIVCIWYVFCRKSVFLSLPQKYLPQVFASTNFNPILRGIKSNLFYAGGGIYAPPMISRKKKFFAQFLLHTQTTIQNRVTHQKPGLYLEKQKNGGRFKIVRCNMTGRISSIFCIFYLFALKWLKLGQFWS